MSTLVCRICRNASSNETIKLRELHFGMNETFEYFNCSSCGTLQILEFPDNMDRYYGKSYYSMSDGNEEISHSGGIKESLKIRRDKYLVLKKGLAGRILNFIKSNTEQRLLSLANLDLWPDMQILDVGCGRGDLMKYLSKLGFSNLTGIDPYIEENFTTGKGLSIQKKSLEMLSQEAVSYDIIMLHHVLEHLQNPLESLLICRKLLKDNGTVIVRIPIKDTFAWKKYREYWVQLDAPRHFFIFTIPGFEMLVKRSALCVKLKKFDSTEFQFWGSEQFQNNIPLSSEISYQNNSSKSIFSAKKISEFKVAAETLNNREDGDQCIFYLKKAQNE